MKKRARKRKPAPNVFKKAGVTDKHLETTTLLLGVIVATSGDVSTKLKCYNALKAMRRLRKIVKESK